MESYDTIIVGAGPAGSTAARLIAGQGARVLLLDRARFPRDKPCGGGVTVNAANAAGIDLSPVVERTITSARISFRQGRWVERTWPEPLAYMTQRYRLDAYLVEQATAAGAELRDGVGVADVTLGAHSRAPLHVRANGDVYQTKTLIGADGANGVVARSLGLTPNGDPLIALEANVPAAGELAERWERTIALDLGGIPGGFGWLFPKGDHLNIGVGGLQRVGPSLRARLGTLCRFLGLDESKAFGLRGYHLPLRTPGAAIARGPALLAGDAAGLVDPFSGEGIAAAFVSGRLAAESIAKYLSGEADGLSEYEASIDRELMPEIEVSRKLQAVFHLMPRPYVFAMQHSDRFWRRLAAVVRGESSYAGFRRSLGPFRYALDVGARVVGAME